MEVLSHDAVPAGPGTARRVVVGVLSLPLAAFFAFVGYSKAFASQADLELHHAWTAYAPWWIGRPSGWIEMAGALALLAATVTPRAWRWTWPFAAFLAASQIWSSIIHMRQGQADSLPQNTLLFVALSLIAAITWSWVHKEKQA